MSDYDQRVARAIVNGEMTTLAADRDAWKARAEKAEEMVGTSENCRLAAELARAESRATQAEAQAAAMRAKLRYHFKTGSLEVAAVINDVCREDDMGRTLLAELEALRALDKMLRGTWTAEERVAALAAVDAAREGE